MLKEFSYWYNCFHKWKSENGDDVETVVECNPITFSGGKGGEREGEKKEAIVLQFTHCLS